MIKRFYAVLAVIAFLFSASPVAAQITVPNTLADGETIDAARLNTNFSTVYGDAFNRTGGTMTGTATMRDIAASTADTYSIGTNGTRFQNSFFNGTVTAGTSTFTTNTSVGGTLAVGGTADFATSITAGSGNVTIIDTTGKIPAISSTYFASLSGANLTGVALLATTNAFTARNDFLTYTETDTSPAISAGTLTVDLSLSSWYTVSLNANITTLTLTNLPSSSKIGSFTIAFTADGTLRTIAWPAAFYFPNSTPPPAMSTTSGWVDLVQCSTADGGTIWLCTYVLGLQS